MWDKIKSAFLAMYVVLWEDRDWKEIVSIFVGIVSGLYLGSTLAYYRLARLGCAVSREWDDILLIGFGGLFMVMFLSVVTGYVVVMVLGIPRFVGDLLEYRKCRKERVHTVSIFRNIRIIIADPDFLKIVIFILLVVIFVVFISFCAGYIWWMIFC